MPTEQELKLRELELKGRELELKEKEIGVERRKASLLLGPLAVAIAGGLLAWAANSVVEYQKAQSAREMEMLKSTIEAVRNTAPQDVEKTRQYFRFIIEVELAPEELTAKLDKYLKKYPDGPLPIGGVIATVASQPSAANVPTPAPSPTPSPNLPAQASAKGWFYLGKSDAAKKVWVDSSGIGTFEIAPGGAVRTGESFDVAALKGKTLKTLSNKYLRDDGTPGKRVLSPIKATLKPGTTLRITQIDSEGTDGGLPVLWAEVEVQS